MGFKVEATILLITLVSHSIAENLADPPTFECLPDKHERFCTIYDPVTSKSNPHFKLSHPTPEKVQHVGVIGGNLAVFTSDICDYFPNLYGIVLEDTGVQELDENALFSCKNLEGWTLHGGKVEEIPLKFFENNKHIRGISFVDTPIKKIDRTQFNGFQKITDFAMSITHIEEFPLESITSEQIFWFHTFSNNLKDFPAGDFMKKFPKVAYVGYGDNDINCSRVQEVNDFFEEQGVSVLDHSWPKPREKEVGEIGGVICIP